MAKTDEQFFWLDKWEGKARGGYYIRNDLKTFFKKLRKEGLKPVCIVVDDSFNLQVLVEAIPLSQGTEKKQ